MSIDAAGSDLRFLPPPPSHLLASDQTTSSSSGVGPFLNKNSEIKSKFQKSEFNLKNVEIIRTVGTGTFGRVIVVHDRLINTYYALKILEIETIVKLKQIEHVKNEKSILLKVENPFIVNLYWTNHDIKFLYMLFEYVCGGELFTYLRNSGCFSNSTTKFYSAEIVSAISYLHSLHIAYRDLKPENLLLDIQGHVKLTDFGFAKIVKDKTFTMCGTPEYLSPEIIQGKGYNKSVDWWALGVLIYEMLTGYPPFYDDNTMQIYQKILNNQFEMPSSVLIEDDAKHLIKNLLVPDSTLRLGCMKGGDADIVNHQWFCDVQWNLVCSLKLLPPIIPKVTHPGDTRCYDKYEEQDWKRVPESSHNSREYFNDF